MQKILILTVLLYSFCIGRSALASGPNESQSPYQTYDMGIRGILVAGNLTGFQEKNFLDIGIFGYNRTQYDNKFFTSVGLLYEVGYSSWKDKKMSYPFCYFKLGVETGFMNQFYCDFYFGGYIGIYILPLIGIRPRYILPLHEYFKIELGGSVNFTPNKNRLYNLHIGIILF